MSALPHTPDHQTGPGRASACQQKFDDLTGTVFAGHHQPLRVWVAALYLMGLNLSNRQIAHELGINEDDAQQLTRQFRQGVVEASTPTLSGTVESDEVYLVAGHKGQHAEVQKSGQAWSIGDQACPGALFWSRTLL